MFQEDELQSLDKLAVPRKATQALGSDDDDRYSQYLPSYSQQSATTSISGTIFFNTAF